MTFISSPPPVVVDASVAVELIVGTDQWRRAFEGWADEDRVLLAPVQLLAEVANALLRGMGLPASEVATRLERLVTAGIDAVDRGLHGLIEAVDLADRHGLSVYDALYLQLALDIEGDLATLDRALQRAAAAENLTVVQVD
jgi:predicted nucleic acid-binding protein